MPQGNESKNRQNPQESEGDDSINNGERAIDNHHWSQVVEIVQNHN